MYIDPTGHMNIVNGKDLDAQKYGKDSTVYNKLEDLTKQYSDAKSKEDKQKIADKAAELRKVADQQIMLNNAGIEGKNGKPLVVDGVKGTNTNYALSVYESQQISQHKASQITTPSENKNIDTSGVKVTYYSTADKTVLSDYSIDLTKTLAVKSGNDTIVITRTIATPESQARAMYNNLNKGPEQVGIQKDIYGAAGDKVIDTYVKSKKAGKNEAEIKADMAKTIIDVGPSNVSKHCYTAEQYKELNTFDVNKDALDDPDVFKKLLKEEEKKGTLKFLDENGCFHIQIYQRKK